MKDIILNKPYKKIQYYLSWFIIIVSIFPIVAIIYLANYGKNTSDNTKIIKNNLNKTYQKFIYIYGTIWFYIILINIIFSFFF